MDDGKIIELYWARSEEAIERTKEKYGRYCAYIAYNILGDLRDTEEIVDDTYMKAWSSIPPTRPESLKVYLGMISRQLSLNRYESKHAKKRNCGALLILDELSECIPDGYGEAEIGESVALGEALNRFVRTLPARTRNIFVKRYWYAVPVSEIARELLMSESNVSVTLLRVRKKLKGFLTKEGYNL